MKRVIQKEDSANQVLNVTLIWFFAENKRIAELTFGEDLCYQEAEAKHHIWVPAKFLTKS